jgi:MFS family permease
VQGIGAGGMMTLAMATVGDLVSPRERGRYQGYIQVTFLFASLVGPLLGGLLVDHVSWRWAFYVNVPIGLVALGLLTAYLRVPSQRRSVQIDFAGAGLLAAAIVAILLVAKWGGSQYAWDSAQIIGLAVAAVALLGAFIFNEHRVAEPILPLRLFRDPVFVAVSAGLFVTTLSLFATIVFLPLFLQLVTGASATGSGLLTLPLLAASALSTIVSGLIMARTGRYKVFPIVGLALMSVGLGLFSTLGAGSSRATAAAYMVLFGLGFGMVTQILVVAIQNAVQPREIGTATAAANLFRALGGSVGVTAFGAIFSSGLSHWLRKTLPGHAAGITPTGIQTTPGRLHTLDPAVQHGIALAVGNSLQDVFMAGAAIALAGLLIVSTLKERPLRGRAAGQGPTGESPEPTSRRASAAA